MLILLANKSSAPYTQLFCVSYLNLDESFSRLILLFVDGDLFCMVLLSFKSLVMFSYSSLLLNPSPNLALLFNQCNNTRPEGNDDPDNVVSSKYYSTNEIQSLKVANKKSPSKFHINVCSLNKNDLDDLEKIYLQKI